LLGGERQWSQQEVERAIAVFKQKAGAEGCKADFETYKALWEGASGQPSVADICATLEKNKETLMDQMDKEFFKIAMKLVKHGLRYQPRNGQPAAEWREAAIRAGQHFLNIPDGREELANINFARSIPLLTMEDDDDEELEADSFEEDEPQARRKAPEKGKREVEKRRSSLAAKVLYEMSHHSEFLTALCDTSILNFLCVLVNQVPEFSQEVTGTIMNVSRDKRNLHKLMEASVGDVLESVFKTLRCDRPPLGYCMVAWKRDVCALGNCAATLATLIKYGHQCQVETATIVYVFNTTGAHGQDTAPDNLRLLAVVAQLFFWICRESEQIVDCFRMSEDDEDPDEVLAAMGRMWEKCQRLWEMIKPFEDAKGKDAKGKEEQRKAKQIDQKFFTDDLDKAVQILPDSNDAKEKLKHARSLICYMSCTMWLCLPVDTLRWKMRAIKFEQLGLAFEMEERELRAVTVTTAQHLLDLPNTQQCSDLVRFFGEKLLGLFKDYIENVIKTAEIGDERLEESEDYARLLVDSLSILAMSRGMQVEMAKKQDELYENLYILCDKAETLATFKDETKGAKTRYIWSNKAHLKLEMCSVYTLCEIAVHPSQRLPWVMQTWREPPADADSKERAPQEAEWGSEEWKSFLDRQSGFNGRLNDFKEKREGTPFAVVAMLLQATFADVKKPDSTAGHRKKEQQSKYSADVNNEFRATSGILKWWWDNTTARYEEFKEKTDLRPTLKELVKIAIRRRTENTMLRSKPTMPYCCPHECILCLSLLSRLALEPEWKGFFTKKPEYIEQLLRCVCVGIWAEAREAAAVLANLMWLPDIESEHLVCWLKFDGGPNGVAIDSANVLMPVLKTLGTKTPAPVDIGKGMYKSTWGIEFVEGSYIQLHPEGLRNNNVPTLLTSASPLNNFAATSNGHYRWIGSEKANDTSYTIACWFYEPEHPDPSKEKHRVLVTARGFESDKKPRKLIWISWEPEASDNKDGKDGQEPRGNFVWNFRDIQGESIPMVLPKLAQGWHHVAMTVCHDEGKKKKRNGNETIDPGTQLYLDGKCYHSKKRLKSVHADNDFYIIGNFLEGGRADEPFGLIADFRIYAKALTVEEVQAIAEQVDVENHPDKIVRELVKMDAVTILAQRLYVPDCAAESLRALGSLATHGPSRAKIFSVCGMQALRLLHSPFDMIQRLAARLVRNMA